jgi:hypothetical protein
MRCDDVRERIDDLWEGEEPADVCQHLTRCESCGRYYRDLRLVRGGFRLLKGEEAPQPSLGFTERLVRQFGEMSKQPSVTDFFELVGRRFVYATLVLTFVTLLALALPPTGPVRGLSSLDLQMPATEASLAYYDPMGETSLQEAPDFVPVESPAPAVTNEVK